MFPHFSSRQLFKFKMPEQVILSLMNDQIQIKQTNVLHLINHI